MPDLIDEMFSSEDDYYPGSRRKRREPRAEPVLAEAPDWHRLGVQKTVGGREMTLYTIGAMAEALGVSVATVRKWTRQGNIPEAPYRLPPTMQIGGEKAPGRRLYSAEYIEATVMVFKKHEVLGSPRISFDRTPGLTVDLIAAWSEVRKRMQQ